MQAVTRSAHARDLKLLQSILSPLRISIPVYRPSVWLDAPARRPILQRGAKTKSTRRVVDIPELQQGAIPVEALPELDPQDEVQYPSYPPVLQGVRDNMARFNNCVVLTRVGNFYELYFEQAEEFGPPMALKVAYRTSTKHPPVPMAGFPFHQLDRFLKMLVMDHNQRVAISEEVPNDVEGKVKSSGNLFNRRVARIVTPGTLIDEKFMETGQNNFLLAIHVGGSDDVRLEQSTVQTRDVGLAWIDLSTGDFWTATTPQAHLGSSIARIAAREIVLQKDIPQILKEEIQAILSHHHDLATYHSGETAFTSIAQWNDVFEAPLDAHVDSQLSIPEKLAVHHLLDYAKYQLQRTQLQLQPPRQREDSQVLCIDRHSLRGLEILETSKDGLGKGSLFHAVKRTVTKSGERLLRQRLVSPSASLEEINARLDLVTALLKSTELREDLVQRLRRTFDVQRIVQRFTLNKGDADDMISLAKAIVETSAVQDRLLSASTALLTDDVQTSPLSALVARFDLEQPLRLAQIIRQSIDEEGLMQLHRQEDEEAADAAAAAIDAVESQGAAAADLVPKSARVKARIAEGRFIDVDMLEAWVMKRTASESIGQLHEALEALKEERSRLQQQLQTDLKAPSLTLKWTPGKGYTCHIRSATAFDRKLLEQMSANMVSSTKTTRSFYLSEWTKLGSRIDHARMQIRSEEQRIFMRLKQPVIENLVRLRRNAAIMDEIDVASGFATLAQEEGWIRPVLDVSTDHQIIGGRHPTVKLGLEEQGRTFVSNDCVLDAKQQIWLVTGPNMAGKSTFLRQNALITILAQVGSYVPAQYARIGIVDQIFSRIGAADDLFRDQSTFMVEMLETAAILKQATPRSFAIVDEVGRGTAPQDGMAIAYGILQHLYEINQCRTLFATHFHRLADMTESWSRVGRYCTDIIEEESGSFIFQHQLKAGVNRNSHALKVAKLAQLPTAALDAAQSVLLQLQEEERVHQVAQLHEPARAVASG